MCIDHLCLSLPDPPRLPPSPYLRCYSRARRTGPTRTRRTGLTADRPTCPGGTTGCRPSTTCRARCDSDAATSSTWSPRTTSTVSGSPSTTTRSESCFTNSIEEECLMEFSHRTMGAIHLFSCGAPSPNHHHHQTESKSACLPLSRFPNWCVR